LRVHGQKAHFEGSFVPETVHEALGLDGLSTQNRE
jgi:hypothetical protein